MTPDLLTVADVAARAQVHPKTVRRAIAAGHLEAMQPTDDGPYRIRPDWYDAWVESRRVSRRRTSVSPPARSVARPAKRRAAARAGRFAIPSRSEAA